MLKSGLCRDVDYLRDQVKELLDKTSPTRHDDDHKMEDIFERNGLQPHLYAAASKLLEFKDLWWRPVKYLTSTVDAQPPDIQDLSRCSFLLFPIFLMQLLALWAMEQVPIMQELVAWSISLWTAWS